MSNNTNNLTTLNGLMINPVNDGDPDLLSGNEVEDFIIKDLDDKPILKFPSPSTGWCHVDLNSIEIDIDIHSQGLNYYLGDQWVGCTEA